MKVLHVTPSFHPALDYGGAVYSVFELCNSLVLDSSIDLRVLTTDSNGPNGDCFPVESFPTTLPAGYDVYYCRRRFGADISPMLFWRLLPMIRWADVVHLTAVYSPPTIPTLFLCRILGKPLVWSSRGALQRWEGSTHTGLKKFWNSLCNLLCQPDRVFLHVTSHEEALGSTIRMTRATPLESPNGIDVPSTVKRLVSCENTLRLLYLGRLHPIKGIENLLYAIQQVDENVRLAICGDGDKKYEKRLRSLTQKLSLVNRVTFYGRISDDQKEHRFSETDVCVVPSFTESFGMVVAESLAHGVPVIASTGTPWRQLENVGCGLWVENSPESLAKAIRRIADLSLDEMGRKGREWMLRDYAWPSIGNRMAIHYGKLVESNSPEARSETVRQSAA